MYRWLNSKRGQNTAEYAILIGVIVAAAIAMQIYVRRGMQARVKEAVDWTTTADEQSGSGVNIFTQQQYEPYYLAANYTTTQTGSAAEALLQGGGVERTAINEATSRTGNMTYSDYTAGNV